eukprot:scaffold3276_cov168-Amphora_coffeaeformis.AAC.6
MSVFSSSAHMPTSFPSSGLIVERKVTMRHTRLTKLLTHWFIFSSLLASVCGENLRRVLPGKGSSKKLKKKSGTKKSQMGRYPVHSTMYPYMKHRPAAYKPWSMNVFQTPNQKSWSSMSTKLWMSKGKGYPSKGTTWNMNWSKGKGFGNEAWKGKGTITKGWSMKSGGGMKGMDKGRYYPPYLYYPDCSVCSSDCISVTQVFLVDSTNNARLFPIQQGEFLDIEFLESFYGVSEFSIECVAKGPAGSMVMADNFGTEIIDNDAPFILAGDNMGDFLDSNFQQKLGNWVVTCQPFCQDNAMGASGPLETTTFFVGPTGPTPPAPTRSPSFPGSMPTQAPEPSTTPDCTTCQEGCLDVVDFVLVDAATNTRIRSIVPGETIDVGPDDQFTVECITNPPPFLAIPFPIGSTILTDNYENINGNPEGSPPYALANDDNGDYNPSGFFQNPGPWDVSCTAFCGPDGSGASSPTRSINFEINAVGPPDGNPVPAPNPPPTPQPGPDCSVCQEGCIFVTGFNLVNAATDTVIGPIEDGDVIQVSDTDQLTIECLTDPAPFAAIPFPIGSTVLTDNFENPRNSENSPPFVLADDNNGDFFASSFFENPGLWIVTCQAFCLRNQQGDASNLATLTFTVERAI